MLLEISFINITKVGTNMALFAFSSFLNTLCSKATELNKQMIIIFYYYVKTDVYIF